jgi:DNA-binding transcriptional regulator YiaG
MKPSISKTPGPTPEQVKAARRSSGLKQQQAAELVHRTERKRWSEWETGVKRMQLDTFELFLIKTGQAGWKKAK